MSDVQVIQTNFDGRRFRSRTEARWAVFFKALGWPYDYEPEGVVLDGAPYLPDFWLPAVSMWLEVKGAEPTPEEVELCRRLARETKHLVLLAVGPPRPGDSIRLFRENGDEDDARYCFASDRRNEGEIWLLSAGGTSAFSIGPVKGPSHDRWPLVHRETATAYDAATGARFEFGESG